MQMTLETALLLISVLLVASLPATSASRPPEDKVIEQKITDLMKKMTIEEKAGQCNQSGFGPYEKFMLSPTGLGHLVIQWGGGVTSEQAVKRTNELQKMAKEKTRLGIPLLIGGDGILDARVADSVTFPQQIGMGSTWNPELVKDIYSVISSEMRAVGYGRTYTPNAGLARDPRFGRTGECFGEDPYHASILTTAAVRGLQGDSLTRGIMATPKHYAAYDASIGGKDSTEMDVSERTLREVWLPPFKAAFDAGAGSVMCAYHSVNGVPCAANRFLLTDILKIEWGFDGFVVTDFICIESLANAQHVASNIDEAARMAFEAGVDVHDHDMGDDFAARLAVLVRKGYISEKVLDEACRRTLRAKFKLGLFENPYADETKAKAIVGSAGHKKVALQAARESLVLLKNKDSILPLKKNISTVAVIGPNADNLYNQIGVWTKEVGPNNSGSVTTILQGIKNQVSPQTKVIYAKGCDVVEQYQPVPETSLIPSGGKAGEYGLKAEYFANKDLSGEPVLVRTDKTVDFDWGNGSPAPEVPADFFSVRWTGKLVPPTTGTYHFSAAVDDGVRLWIDDELIIDAWPDHVGTSTASIDLVSGKHYDLKLEYHESAGQAVMKLGIGFPGAIETGINEAVEAAKKSDVAIVVVGDSPQQNSEGHDRADLNLTGAQEELVKAVYATGKPTVVVLVNGRPLTVNWIVKNIPAIIEAWNPGEQGGTAVAEALFGDYNPGGKLPITFPRSVGQLPVYYNYEPGWHATNYIDGTEGTPLYQFGYGLSYTTFTYTSLKLSSEKMKSNGTVEVSVDVQNTGDREGDEVVQLYMHDTVASLVRPVKELKHFRRIHLKPGEKQTVSFKITPNDLAFYNQKMKRVVEPGSFEIMVSGNPAELQVVKLEVTE